MSKEWDLVNIRTDGSEPQKQEAWQRWLGDLSLEEAQRRLTPDDEAHGRPYRVKVADEQLTKTFERAREVNEELAVEKTLFEIKDGQIPFKKKYPSYEMESITKQSLIRRARRMLRRGK